MKNPVEVARKAKGELESKAESIGEVDQKEEESSDLDDIEFFRRDEVRLKHYMEDLEEITWAQDIKPKIYCEKVVELSRNTRELLLAETKGIQNLDEEKRKLSESGLNSQAEQKADDIKIRATKIHGMADTVLMILEEAKEVSNKHDVNSQVKKDIEEEIENIEGHKKRLKN